MDPIKVSGIEQWPTLSKVKEVQQFLRFANFYRQFIDHYVDITKPLDWLWTKDHEWAWTTECDTAFQMLQYGRISRGSAWRNTHFISFCAYLRGE